VIKALLLIFDPAGTWDRIAQARRSFAFVTLVYLLPMLILPSIIEGFGLMHFGEWQQNIQRKKIFTAREAIIFEFVQTCLLFLVVLIGGKMIKSLCDTFHQRHTYTQAFTTAAYGLSPVLLFRVLDLFPMTPWLPWMLGVLLMTTVLYHGVPRVMEPDPSHAFGLFLSTWLVLALTTGILRFATASFLAGKFPALQRLI
jgi:hypothetical protein